MACLLGLKAQFIGTPGVAQGSEKGILFLNRNCTAVKNRTSCQNKTAKAGINSISGVSPFFKMPGPNKAKVLPILIIVH